MTTEEIKSSCNKGVTSGFMFEQDNVMLNTDEGANHSALAVLGTLFLHVGKNYFNKYLDVQSRWLGRFKSKTNVIMEVAYKYKKEYRLNNPKIKEMFRDAEDNFINPIFAKHIQSGGKIMTEDQKENICAILLAKIMWDLYLGNDSLAKYIRDIKYPDFDKLYGSVSK